MLILKSRLVLQVFTLQVGRVLWRGGTDLKHEIDGSRFSSSCLGELGSKTLKLLDKSCIFNLKSYIEDMLGICVVCAFICVIPLF